jgi:hypothetical protein
VTHTPLDGVDQQLVTPHPQRRCGLAVGVVSIEPVVNPELSQYSCDSLGNGFVEVAM